MPHLLSLVAAFGLPLFAGARAPLPGVVPPVPFRSLSAEVCRPCHEAQFQQWRGSQHATAATNALFRASFRQEPLDWCKYCHAPLAEQVAALKGVRDIAPGRSDLVGEGVTCAACHVRDGMILVTRPATAAAQRAHPIRVTPELSSSAFCGSCHQVNWPLSTDPFRYSDQPMQDTLAESRRAPAKVRSCQQCHMPTGAHRFRGGHDLEWLRETVTARIWLESGNRLHLVVRVRGIGHRFPTGDPFRRLRVDLCKDPECEEPFVAFSFGRFFQQRSGRQVLVRDTALPVPPDRSEESFNATTLRIKPPGTPLFWRLRYAYAAPSTESRLRPDEIEAEIAAGTVSTK